jgi:lysozyme family protein
MKENFEKIISWVHLDEGEYSDDEGDDGGPTRLGITIYDWARWSGQSRPERGTKHWAKLTEEVKNLDEDTVKRIYRAWYWDECSCDDLPGGVDYFIFDCGLLSGTGTAIRWLQRSVGAVPDGVIGPKTRAAIQADDAASIISKVEALRRSRLKSLKDWKRFGHGWTNRVNKSVLRAKKLVKPNDTRAVS